jgi:hypothetical protein
MKASQPGDIFDRPNQIRSDHATQTCFHSMDHRSGMPAVGRRGGFCVAACPGLVGNRRTPFVRNQTTVTTMLKKYFSLQYWLDALFDDGWCTLGVPDGFDGADALLQTD